jgi:hypothetical protein
MFYYIFPYTPTLTIIYYVLVYIFTHPHRHIYPLICFTIYFPLPPPSYPPLLCFTLHSPHPHPHPHMKYIFYSKSPPTNVLLYISPHPHACMLNLYALLYISLDQCFTLYSLTHPPSYVVWVGGNILLNICHISLSIFPPNPTTPHPHIKYRVKHNMFYSIFPLTPTMI